MRKMILLSIFAMLLTAGCASSMHTLLPTREIIDMPSLEEVQLTELGDTIVSKGVVYQYDGLELFNTVFGGSSFIYDQMTVPAGELIARAADDKWTYFYSNKCTAYNGIVGTYPLEGGLKVSKSGRKSEIFLRVGGRFGSLKPNPKPDFKIKKIYAIDKPSFRQELIYNGKSGDSVKFLYRELSNSLMRAPFSQEIQYDLRDSMTIGFKGVRIEITEATNTYLKYKVLKSFPDSE